MTAERPHPKRRKRPWQVRERLVLGLLALLPIAMVYGAFHWLQIIAVAWLSMLAAVAIVIMRGDWRLIGPHAFYDLVRLARRGRSSVVRVLYLLAMLTGLGIAYVDNIGRPTSLAAMFAEDIGTWRSHMTRLAELFSAAVIIVQNLAVLLLTPIYLATALTEEREKGTLVLLQATHLHDREILLGKLLGRLGHLAGVLLAGLPVISLAQFIGGVDMTMLLANFAVTAMNLWTVGCICLAVSVISRTSLEAMIQSYLLVLATLIGCGCVTMFTISGRGEATPLLLPQQTFAGNLSGLLHTLWVMLLANAVVSSFWLTVALGALRPLLLKYQPPRRGQQTAVQVGDSDFEATNHAAPVEPLPPISENPLLWKELNAPRRSHRQIIGEHVTRLDLALGIFVILLLAFIFFAPVVAAIFRTAPHVLHFIIAWIFWLGLGYRTCASVARERQRATLDSLLTLPVDWKEILQAKWLAAILRGAGLACFSLVMLFFDRMVNPQFHFVDALLQLLAFAAFTAFLASLGMFYSVTSTTVLQAQTKMGLTVFLLLLLGLVDSWIDPNLGWLVFFNKTLNPFTMDLYLRTWDTTRGTDSMSRSATIVLWLLGSAAIVLWAWAVRRFQKRSA